MMNTIIVAINNLKLNFLKSTIPLIIINSFLFPNIFITELADPNNNSAARYVELYNNGVDIDLGSGWQLQRYTNGNADPQSPVALTGIIATGGYYVISSNGGEFLTTYGVEASQDIGTGGPADSNGDDQIYLVNPSGDIIDFFGVPGEDGSGTDHEFEDGRAERTEFVITGNNVYDVNEWYIDNDSGGGDGPQDAPDAFDPFSWIGEGPILYIYGCTDELAINYNPLVTIDDNTCYYLDDIVQHFQQNWQGIPFDPMGIYVTSAIFDGINLRIGDEIAVFDGNECVGVIQLSGEITTPIQIFASQDDPYTNEMDGFEEGENIIYKYWDASEQIEVINVNSTLLNGDDVFTPLGFSEVDLQVNSILGCTEIYSINYNPDATVNDGTCIPTIIGCMDINACNFDPDANLEGDCLLFDCAQICDGSSYVDDCDVCDDDPSNDNECYGCMDLWALNYDPNSTINDDSCEYPSIGDISMDGLINVNDIVLLVGIVLDGEFYIEYMDINQDSYLNIIDIVILVDIILNPETLGCTDPNTINFDPLAIYEDGSCEYEGILIDIDGNLYQILAIGSQVWMIENLNVTHYKNGDVIPNITDINQWGNLTEGAYSYYDNDPQLSNIYGKLYHGFTIDDDRGICPDGWHIPVPTEWTQMMNYLGSWIYASGKMKSTGTHENGDGYWHEPNTGATNESGFSAHPGGLRSSNNEFEDINNKAFFWSTRQGDYGYYYAYELTYHSQSVDEHDNLAPRFGLSVRCVRD
jgi:uncharacterized protein (TIGR02145 family)